MVRDVKEQSGRRKGWVRYVYNCDSGDGVGGEGVGGNGGGDGDIGGGGIGGDGGGDHEIGEGWWWL